MAVMVGGDPGRGGVWVDVGGNQCGELFAIGLFHLLKFNRHIKDEHLRARLEQYEWIISGLKFKFDSIMLKLWYSVCKEISLQTLYVLFK